MDKGSIADIGIEFITMLTLHLRRRSLLLYWGGHLRWRNIAAVLGRTFKVEKCCHWALILLVL